MYCESKQYLFYMFRIQQLEVKPNATPALLEF